MSDGALRARLALQAERAAELETQLLALLAPLTGVERVLDAGCGTGALALALAPHVGSVVGVDQEERFLAAATEAAPANCSFLWADAGATGLPAGTFDLTCCLRVLHHASAPATIVAELARLVRPGGRVLLVDQLREPDAGRAAAAERFEQARDPSHVRLLSDDELQGLLREHHLVVEQRTLVAERRSLDSYLDLVGLAGPDRDRVAALAPSDPYAVELGWYLARAAG